ncbi:hypothetical protein AJ79_04134 [Helicocarpus griseus UAMH5409]|uniref:Secreted protein n=1 Tax=Helicocarpus griseus UAMH5409 TaxID=1447875 RepID=A0A2B7XTV3_9EURO|nr:hypothetical protein AJ79_04134 [Helicocarpus griseus UAMH5409]
MKVSNNSLLLATATALCALPSAFAAFENITASDFTLKASGYSDVIADLDAVLPVKTVKEVLADTNHKNPTSSPEVKHALAGYTWENKEGYDDVNTDKWYPQGITTSTDADDSGAYDGDVVHLVSWHSDKYDSGKRGARISFVNMNDGADRAYRNVLLVRPTQGGSTPNFEAVSDLHAGGIVWYGNLLYVVSTKEGLLVFDMSHIYEVSTGDGIGRVGENYQAYGYKYVLPQARTYAWQAKDGVSDMRFSFVGLDKTSSPESLVVGEWLPAGNGRVVHWNLDESSRLLEADSNSIATASRAVEHTITNIQGSLTINDKYFLTQSGGSLWTFSWAGGQEEHKDIFSDVPEDLSYQAGYGLWSLMEVPGNRHVVALDVDQF